MNLELTVTLPVRNFIYINLLSEFVSVLVNLVSADFTLSSTCG